MDGVQKSEFLLECNSFEFTPDTRVSYNSCQYFNEVHFLSFANQTYFEKLY